VFEIRDWKIQRVFIDPTTPAKTRRAIPGSTRN